MFCSKMHYIEAKTKDLIEFGYTKLTEEEVEEQVNKIIAGDKDLSVIGLFCKDDIHQTMNPTTIIAYLKAWLTSLPEGHPVTEKIKELIELTEKEK